METKVLGQDARQYFLSENSTFTVEQQLEFERLAVEREKAKLALQNDQEARAAQREHDQAQREHDQVQREQAQVMLQRERLAMEAEREKFEISKVRMQEETEQNRIRLQHKMQQELEEHKAKMELEAQLTIKVEQERAKISVETKGAEQEVLKARASFDLAKNIKLVPNFIEYDPEDYFRLFEETAKHLKWPENQ